MTKDSARDVSQGGATNQASGARGGAGRGRTAGATPSLSRRVVRGVLWGIAGLLVLALALGVYVVWPIVFPGASGVSGQQPVSGYPTTVTATGEDGRTRTLSATAEDGSEIDLSTLRPGDRVVVSGAGFNPAQGVYVAVCRIPDAPTSRPGPCLGGVPSTDVAEADTGVDGDRVAQWAPANWINDDWAWKLFGARGFDDRELGTFTAYIDIPAAADEYVDCTLEDCGLFTRNDHTAIDNRMQDLYLPVSFPR